MAVTLVTCYLVASQKEVSAVRIRAVLTSFQFAIDAAARAFKKGVGPMREGVTSRLGGNWEEIREGMSYGDGPFFSS